MIRAKTEYEKEKKRMHITKNYKEGNRIEILKILHASGGLPYRALRMIPGTLLVVQRMALRMQEEKLITVVQSKRNGKILGLPRTWRKNIALYEGCLPEQYVMNYEEKRELARKNKYESEAMSIERMIKQGEINLMMHMSGVKSYPDEKKYFNVKRMRLYEKDIMYFESQEIKKTSDYTVNVEQKEGEKKLSGSRMHGLMVSPGGQYAVYNIGNKLIEWERFGEVKMSNCLKQMLAEKYRNKKKIELSCLLLGESMEIFARVIANENKNRRNMTLLNIDYAYEQMYALPTTKDGIKMLKLMSEKGWQNKMKAVLLAGINREEINRYNIVCDAVDKESYILLFCIPDIARLKSFMKRASIEHNKDKYHIYCFDYQLPLLAKIINDDVTVSSMTIDEYIDLTKGEEAYE